MLFHVARDARLPRLPEQQPHEGEVVALDEQPVDEAAVLSETKDPGERASLHHVDRRVARPFGESSDDAAGAVADHAAYARPAGPVVEHGAVEVELVPPRPRRRPAHADHSPRAGGAGIAAGSWRRWWIAGSGETGTARDAMSGINKQGRATERM